MKKKKFSILVSDYKFRFLERDQKNSFAKAIQVLRKLCKKEQTNGRIVDKKGEPKYYYFM